MSFAAFLDAEWYVPSGDYDLALRIVRKVVRDFDALEEMYRRMVFNVVAHNRNDHWKQHALLMSADGSWTLAPAFDLTPNSGPRGEHYLTINGHGKDITFDDLLAVANTHAIRRPKAKAIIDHVRTAVADFERARREVQRHDDNRGRNREPSSLQQPPPSIVVRPIASGCGEREPL